MDKTGLYACMCICAYFYIQTYINMSVKKNIFAVYNYMLFRQTHLHIIWKEFSKLIVINRDYNN